MRATMSKTSTDTFAEFQNSVQQFGQLELHWSYVTGKIPYHDTKMVDGMAISCPIL